MTRIENTYLRHDPNSMFAWEQLNETKYLTRVFEELEGLMGGKMQEYDFITFSHQNGLTAPASIEGATHPNKKKVLIFLSNEMGGIPAHLSSYYHAIFKGYLDEGERPYNIFPFPLGYANSTEFEQPAHMEQRSVNVYYKGNLNKNRVYLHYLFNQPVVKNYSIYQFFLRAAKNLRLPIKRDFSGFFPNSHLIFTTGFQKGNSQEYSDFLKSTKIALCPRGFFSAETYRHYETMKAGCIIISEKLPKHIFYKGSPIIQVDDWAEGLQQVRNLLADPERLDMIQRETLLWWEENCSETATAKYMKDCLEALEDS